MYLGNMQTALYYHYDGRKLEVNFIAQHHYGW